MKYDKIIFKGGKQHEEETNGVLDEINQNPVGKIVLKMLNRDRPELKLVYIHPFRDKDVENKTFCNALAIARNKFDAAPKGQRIYKWNDPATPQDESLEYETILATGQGSHVDIYFTKARHLVSECDNGRRGNKPDESLFHELVHALRMLDGIYLPRRIHANLKQYGNEEEYLAIQVTNVYSSAANVTQLRGAWKDGRQLPVVESCTAGFLKNTDHMSMMMGLRMLWKEMFEALLTVHADFNPFAEIIRGGTSLGPHRSPQCYP